MAPEHLGTFSPVAGARDGCAPFEYESFSRVSDDISRVSRQQDADARTSPYRWRQVPGGSADEGAAVMFRYARR